MRAPIVAGMVALRGLGPGVSVAVGSPRPGTSVVGTSVSSPIIWIPVLSPYFSPPRDMGFVLLTDPIISLPVFPIELRIDELSQVSLSG